MASSVRLPRVRMSWRSHWNSSGIQLSPTPRPTRSFESTAADETALATSSGSRIASFRTFV